MLCCSRSQVDLYSCERGVNFFRRKTKRALDVFMSRSVMGSTNVSDIGTKPPSVTVSARHRDALGLIQPCYQQDWSLCTEMGEWLRCVWKRLVGRHLHDLSMTGK